MQPNKVEYNHVTTTRLHPQLNPHPPLTPGINPAPARFLYFVGVESQNETNTLDVCQGLGHFTFADTVILRDAMRVARVKVGYE